MRANGSTVAVAVSAVLVGAWVLVGAGQSQDSGILQEPLGVTGEAIFPAWEGWGPNKDGKDVFLIGYFNRNQTAVDIPIGPNNRIEPGGPDLGQPTYFRPTTGHSGRAGRHYGVFAIELPEDLGNNRLTWTLNAFGHTTTVNFWRNPPYWIDFFKMGADGNEPPRVKFSSTGTEYQGPPAMEPALELTGTVNQPVALGLLAADQPPTYEPGVTRRGGGGAAAGRDSDEPSPAGQIAIIGGQVIDLGARGDRGGGGGFESQGDVIIYWSKYRGPANGEVSFDKDETHLYNEGDPSRWVQASNNAYFSEPGEYWLLAIVSDGSDPQEECCWTTAHVKVTIS